MDSEVNCEMENTRLPTSLNYKRKRQRRERQIFVHIWISNYLRKLRQLCVLKSVGSQID